MKTLITLNPEKVSELELASYAIRYAVRAVVVDAEGLIALAYVSNENYFKIPGGGKEGDEDDITALKRECREEIGCEIEIIGEIGAIVEYRKIFSLNQTSYCYFAKVTGAKGRPDFTESEKADGFKQIWLPYKQAVKVATEAKAKTVEGSLYIVPRDSLFLKEAKKFLN